MTIKILHLVLTLDTGGLENGVVNIINGLDDKKFTSIVCCIKHGGELVGRIRSDVKVIELNHYSGISYSVLINIRKLISYYEVDVVHTRNYKPFLFGFLSAKLFRKTVLVHSEHGKDYPFHKVKMLIQYICSFFTDAVIALSDDIKSNMIRHVGIDEKKIKVIINGVDTGKFLPSLANNDLRSELGLNKDDIVVGAVGRLVKVKNYPELLQSVKIVREQGLKVKLVIVGDGPMLDNLKSLSLDYGIFEHVTFAGNRNDINEVLNLFDIYVLPSSNEGLSNTLLEAMSSGVPAIASRVGGNVEVINSEHVGCLYESGDVAELTDIIVALYNNEDLRRSKSKNAREHIVSLYSLDAMIENYSDLYTDVYNRNRR